MVRVTFRCFSDAGQMFHLFIGHNIVPGVIQTGTLLYHGSSRNTIPSEPDWIATDPEHSIVFARGYGTGWHLTLAATRPLKVLYFDGSSAAKVSEGTMDTQDIIAWGEVQPERFNDERTRIKDLCRWGKEIGIDGFARSATHLAMIYN
jgi:hypothetical protein